MRILITGSAGFIGFHLARRLLNEGDEVCGVDNFNDYYSVELKEARNDILEKCGKFYVERINIASRECLQAAFDSFKPDVVINLAAQTGVRYSLEHPEVYAESNLVGFLNVLECCRHAKSEMNNRHPALLYASSSSVYGTNKDMPFTEDQRTDSVISLYAASKKANELMAHTYSSLYGVQALGFRFFSVYGPWGRPDMVSWLFAQAMADNAVVKLFNHGNMRRDFTYVDDIVEGLVRCVRRIDALPKCDVYNIGNHRAESLMDVLSIIAREMGVASPRTELLPMQAGDIPASFASIEKINKAVGFEPRTPISVGLPRFCAWFKEWSHAKRGNCVAQSITRKKGER